MMNSSTRKQTIYYFNDHLAMKALKHISFVVIHCNMAMQSTHLKLNYSFFCQVQVILKVINYYCTMYSKIYVDNYFILRQ